MECEGYGDMCPLCLGDQTLCEGCGLPFSDCGCGSLYSGIRCYKCGGAGILLQFEKTAQEVGKIIDLPVKEWEGNCYGVACVLLSRNIVKGTARHGHWRGPVSPLCGMFYGKPIVRHGWVELPDGKIVDPTRWVFEAADPYIFYGEDEDKYYDIGGMTHLQDRRMGAPPFDPEDKKEDILFPEPALEFLRELLEVGPYFTQTQIWWIAHLTPPEMGKHGKIIYQALVNAGFKALIPIDLRKLVLED